MHPTYELNTLSDLMRVPFDRLPACLRDLEYALTLAHFAGGEEAEGMRFDSFVWTDDGDHSVSMKLNGEPLLTLEVTQDDTPPAARRGEE